MRIFNFNIGKKKAEKRNCNLSDMPIFASSLNFGNFCNSQSALNISAAYRATSLISDAVAMLPITIKANKKDIVDNHPLNMVFKNSLGTMTKYNFMKMLIQSVIMKGNGYAYINRASDGTVLSLRFLDDVSIQYDRRKNMIWYTSATIGGGKIEACNMIHLKKNSYDGNNGVSIISYATRSLKIANNTENSANNFFSNGCNLSGVLTVQGQLSDKQRQDIRASWNQAYSEGGSGIAVLQGNMSYSPIQLSASDSQMLESRLFNTQDIARFFEVNPILLGDLSHSSYSTIEAAQTDFLLHTLLPYVTMIEEEFTRKLIKPSEANLTVNLEENYLLRTDKATQANYYSTMLNAGVMSINEVRKQLGMAEIKDGDKHLIAYTKIEDNTIGGDKNKEDKNNVTDEKNL